jgi:arylsulfatase A-like enzyme
VAYEESVRVPLILRLPDQIRRGHRSKAPVSQIDIAPTLAGLCGLPKRSEWRGQDLAHVLTGASEPDMDRPLYCLHRPLGDWMRTVPWRMVTRNALKYVWSQGDRDELFDLESDPYETTNLIDAPDYAESLHRLRNDLADFMRQTSDVLESAYRSEVF